MGKSSQLRTFVSVVCFSLVILMSQGFADEALHLGEEQKNINIHLINGFYANGSYLVSQDTKEVDEISGSFGWQKTIKKTTIDIGASHSLFSGATRFGTFKPYVRIHGDFTIFRNQNVKPFIRLDVTPAFSGAGATAYHHTFGIEHAWVLGDRLSFNEQLRISGTNGEQYRMDYHLGLSLHLSEGIRVEAISHTFRDETGTDNSINARFVLRH